MTTGLFAVEIPETTVQSAIGAALAIPADRYAVVRAQVQDGETFLINGTVVLSSQALDIASKYTVFTGNAAFASVTGAGRIFEGRETNTTAQGVDFNGVIAPSVPATLKAGPSTTITVVAGGGAGAVKGIIGAELGKRNTTVSQVFRLPPGSTISGGRYHCELYRVPGSDT